jgi:hypothetical protein
MYKIILALFLILTIFSTFAGKKTDANTTNTKSASDAKVATKSKTTDPRIGRPGPSDPKNNEFRDEVVRGESSIEHRAQARPGNHRDINKGPGVTEGVNCTTTEGQTVGPKDKLYKKCVDNANRIK